ncbi:MAG: ParB/RepB/Spo0J family partition protein [Clostridia bacterium]|nr:ParB/RepB/Spo0J family partition protein [Clostridia bacterium]
MSIVKAGAEGGGRQVCWLPVSSIVPNPHQPRREFDDYALLALASSIRQHGLLQPITVRARDNGYEIIMGERRFRACCLLGFTHIDAFILPATEGESALLALIENLQRENLHYFEEAEAYASLTAQGMTQETIARRLGKSASGIANKIRLLKLEPELRRFLQEEGLSERHARALLALPDGAARMRIAQQAARQGLTVKEEEQLIQKAQRRLPVPPAGRKVISLVRDHRLYANAIKSVVKQMQETGMPADMDIQEGEGWIDMHIRMGRRQGR